MKNMGFIGFWAFIIGLILAIVAGIFFPEASWVAWVLLILGVLIGILNISDREYTSFLIATIALIVIGGIFSSVDAGWLERLDNVLTLIATLMAPAAIIVAIKTLWSVGKPEGK